MAVDPVEYIDSGAQYFQRYTYADNNPFKYTDPSGEMMDPKDVTDPDRNGTEGAGSGGGGNSTSVNESLGMGLIQEFGNKLKSWGSVNTIHNPIVAVPVRNPIKTVKDITKEPAEAFANLPLEHKKLANKFMTQFAKGEPGAKQLLDHINKNGVPKIDKTTQNALKAYRDTITAIGGKKKTANTGVFKARVEILEKVLSK
jgi:hypothetical protein